MDLERAALFTGIPSELLTRVRGLAKIRHYAPDEDIFHEDEPAKDVFVLRHGRVELTYTLPQDPTTQFLITHIEPGENFAWSALALGESLSSRARAMVESSAFVIPARSLHAVFLEHPEVGYRVMTKLSQQILTRLRETRKELRWLHQAAMR